MKFTVLDNVALTPKILPWGIVIGSTIIVKIYE